MRTSLFFYRWKWIR